MSSKAPVDESIFFSSISTPFGVDASDPVAIIIFFALMISDLSSNNISISFLLMSFPKPLFFTILFFLNKKSMPSVKLITLLFFASIILLISKLKLENDIPKCFISCACLYK